MSTTRRVFTAALGGAVLSRAAQAPRPNILWITCEDIGPHLHACGDDYSVTPNLDKLCQRGMIYMNAWSNAPVCAPARTTIISGVYPPSTGSEHMRSLVPMPAGQKMFPAYLREAGYYCTNNAKEDYNLVKPDGTWDESSKQAHWRKRAAGQPFFAVFNHEITHESQIRTRPHTFVHDPAKARVPAYHPDTPEVRLDWAQYYDNITTMDGQAGKLLADLQQDGLAEDTIVVFFGDHGSGMPRSKRWPYNSGLNVSIVVSIPKRFRHLASKDYVEGQKSNRLVGFVDLAPTMLSLAGIKPPAHLQGHAFLGPQEAPARRYSFGFRGRMDERIDCVRSVRDDRYVYIRNYMPHRIYGQHLAYMWETPTTAVWEKLYKQGKLRPPQTFFWEPKPEEELYDLAEDRDEVRNLAESAAHAGALKRLRDALDEQIASVRDIGLLPEAEMHDRWEHGAPFDARAVHAAARRAASRDMAAMPWIQAALNDKDSGVRYWAATGVLIRGAEAVRQCGEQLVKNLEDASPSVRVPAAEALARYGGGEHRDVSLQALLKLSDIRSNSSYTAILALNAIDNLGEIAASVRPLVAKLPTSGPNLPVRTGQEYLKRLVEDISRAG